MSALPAARATGPSNGTAPARIAADRNRSAATHLIRLERAGGDGVSLYLEDESTHPSGSLKHRLARSLFLCFPCNGQIVRALGRKCGGATGTDVFGALALLDEMWARGEQGSVATLIRAAGERRLDSYYDPDWVAAQGRPGPVQRPAGGVFGGWASGGAEPRSSSSRIANEMRMGRFQGVAHMAPSQSLDYPWVEFWCRLPVSSITH